MPVLMGRIRAPAMHDDLIGVFDEVVPDVVVHDLAEFAAAPIAASRGLPHVTSGFSGALSDPLQDLMVEAVAPLWAHHGLEVTSAAVQGDVLLHPLPASVDQPRQDGPSAPLRPLSFDGSFSPPPDWVRSFGGDRPGVYVTFGTVNGPDAPWAEIFSALGDIDVDVVATVGGGVDPGTLGPIPANVRVEGYVPQGHLLERAQLVLSHAGAGTVIASASCATPQVFLPIAADQWDNADTFSAAGAGLTLEPDQRDAPSIAGAVTRLLRDATVEKQVSGLAAEFEAMPHPADLVTTIEALV